MEEISRRKRLNKPARNKPLQIISTDTWDISDQLHQYSRISDLLKGSITIVEDRADETENKTREHLQNIVTSFWNNEKGNRNPWEKEFLPHWPKNLEYSYFKIDSKVSNELYIHNWTCFFSKVENVMNAAVLYYDTITKYRDFKCKAGRGAIGACLQGTFDGEEYFNEFILKHDGQPLFGDKSRRVKLDSCGDSTPRYAIYQLQNTRLTYYVRLFFLFSLP